MVLKRILAAALAILATASVASAATVSPTILSNGLAVTQTVNVEDDSGLINDANWFIFRANAGDLITIEVNRLEAAPDLAAEIYFGNVTGLDFGTTTADFSGGASSQLTFVQFRDDTVNDAFGGPWGDPRFNLTVSQTGIFSLHVSTLNLSGVGGQFEVVATGISAIPLPPGLPLLAAGLSLFGMLGVRQARSAA